MQIFRNISLLLIPFAILSCSIVDSNSLEEGTFNASIPKGLNTFTTISGDSYWFQRSSGGIRGPMQSERIVLVSNPVNTYLDQQERSIFHIVSYGMNLKKGVYSLGEDSDIRMTFFYNHQYGVVAYEGEIIISRVTENLISGQFSMKARPIYDEDSTETFTFNGKFSAKPSQSMGERLN
jgi:hypothetical protein